MKENESSVVSYKQVRFVVKSCFDIPQNPVNRRRHRPLKQFGHFRSNLKQLETYSPKPFGFLRRIGYLKAWLHTRRFFNDDQPMDFCGYSRFRQANNHPGLGNSPIPTWCSRVPIQGRNLPIHSDLEWCCQSEF